MTVEIISVTIEKGVVRIDGIDVSEERLQYLERRDDGRETEVEFVFDTKQKKHYEYLNNWLHRQKRIKEQSPATWGEALYTVCGTVTTISGKYLEFP